MDEKQAQKQAEKQSTAKAGATAAHIAADYYTGGEYEQIRNAPVIGNIAKAAEQKVGERVASMPGAKGLGKAAKALDDEGIIDAVDDAAGMIAGSMGDGGQVGSVGNDPKDVDALKNRGTNQADFGSSYARNTEIPDDTPSSKEGLDPELLGADEGLDAEDRSNQLKDGSVKNNKGLGLGKTQKDEVREAGVFGDLKTKWARKWKKIKLALIIIGIIAGLYLIVFFITLLISLGTAIFGSLSTFFGIPEVDTKENMSVEESDGLIQNEEYLYDENGEPYTLDELVTELKNDSTCSKVTFWNGIGDWFDSLDGKYGNICAYIRYIESYIKDIEKAHPGVTLDRSLILSTIFYGYASQASPTEYDNPEDADILYASEHYKTLINVLEDGKIKKADLEKIMDNTLANTSYTYYDWEVEIEKDSDGNPTKGIGKCVSKTVRDTRYSLTKYKIFMRFGETAAKTWEEDQVGQKGFAGSDEECLGKISEDDLLARVKTASGAATNELDKSVKNAHKAMKNAQETNISALEQKANTKGHTKDQFEPYVGNGITLTLDYKNGFAYNKFPGYKEAFENPSIDLEYDDAITPKEIEETIEIIIDKKVTMNEILQFTDQDEPDRYKNSYNGYSSVILGAYCGDLLTAPLDQINVYVTDCDGAYIKTVTLKDYITGVAYGEINSNIENYVKTQMVVAQTYALNRRGNYNKGTTIKMKSGNCDQVYCPLREGCHSKSSSLVCHSDGRTCVSYVPGPGWKSVASTTTTTQHDTWYEEIKDMLIIDPSTNKLAPVSYVSTRQNEWKKLAESGMNFTQIIQESYTGKGYEIIQCSDYTQDNSSDTSSSSSSSSQTEMYGNGPTTEYTEIAPDLGKFYGFSYKSDGGRDITINPVWVTHNIVNVNSNCEEANWNVDYKVNKQAVNNYKTAFSNVCKMLTTGVKISNGTTCTYTIEDLQGGETYVPRKTATGTISDLSYGIIQEWNYNKQYTINGKIYQPYGYSRDNAEYQAFIKELGKEEDCRNVNYVLYKYAYQPAGFEWGGNWGSKDNVNTFNGMHFYVKYE